MSKKITTHDYKLTLMENLIKSISNFSDRYYVFLANHIPRDTSSIPDITENIRNIYIEPYRKMEFGKSVNEFDVSMIIKNIPYESNTIYDMYDDLDEFLFNKNYYVIVNASSFYHIYKVLDNNRGAYSTVEPNFVHISGSNSYIYQTSDGYRWKYMYSVSSSMKDKYLSDQWFPLIANNSVKELAVDGTIDVIKIDGTGFGYHNYSKGIFSSFDVKIDGDPLLYQISNNSLKHVNGYYTGCIMYLSNGTGAGQFRTISDYFSNANGNFIRISSEFLTVPSNDTTWEINPYVKVKGYGRNIVNIESRALVNANFGNSIYRVEILERGSGYYFAEANVIANSVIGITKPAVVRPIMSPYGGHGFNVGQELNSKGLMFSVKFDGNEYNRIPTNNVFQQIGLMKNPIYSKASFELKSLNGSFIDDEIIYKVKPIRVQTNGTVNTTCSYLTSTIADFENQFKDGDYIYLVNTNDTEFMLTTVRNVINSSTINLSSNGFFACNQVRIYQTNVYSSAIFYSQANLTNVTVSNIDGIFDSNDIFIGNLSGCRGVINSVSISGVTKTFGTFIQMSKFVGSLSSGTFIDNEFVYQGSSFANAVAVARIYSSYLQGSDLIMYTSNQIGKFEIGTLIGANSLAQATISTIHEPELIEGSGQIFYIENIQPINRDIDQNEIIQISFNF